MPTLTTEQMDDVRAELLTERTRLLASVASLDEEEAILVAAASSRDNRVLGEGEGDAVAVERHLVAKLTETARTALSEVEAALARIDDGSYGVCQACAEDIPAARLEVRPRTTTCVPCASRR